jgi:hypothetical protein
MGLSSFNNHFMSCRAATAADGHPHRPGPAITQAATASMTTSDYRTSSAQGTQGGQCDLALACRGSDGCRC